MSIAAVPDIETIQLPLFESERPTKFEFTLAGTIKLSLKDADEAILAQALKLGRPFGVAIVDPTSGEHLFGIDATVTKRVHKIGGNDAIISAATLTIAKADE